MKMKQVMSHNINNGLLNIIRRTDPMINDPYGKYDYNKAAREQISDAYDGESDARWNTD